MVQLSLCVNANCLRTAVLIGDCKMDMNWWERKHLAIYQSSVWSGEGIEPEFLDFNSGVLTILHTAFWLK